MRALRLPAVRALGVASAGALSLQFYSLNAKLDSDTGRPKSWWAPKKDDKPTTISKTTRELYDTKGKLIEDSGCSMNEAAALERELYWEGGTEDPFHVYRRESDLPIMSLAEVNADHGTDTWCILDGGVYDVTTFLEAHPGGQHRIAMTQGNDLRKYWDVYKLHDRPHIRALLERYRIGNLTPEDAQKVYDESPDFGNYYANDPERPRREELRIPTEHPWNSEPQLSVLTDSFYTPNDLFFVRNHNSVPEIEEADWTLEINAENQSWGMKAKEYTLNDLKTKFPRVEVIATLQCAGNRQEDFVQRDRPLYVAPHWRNGAIGNAKWHGVRVRDILKDCGMDVDAMSLRQKDYPGMKIVNFIGVDEDETGVPYAGVLPIEKVIDPFGDAILAYEMNGETLPRDHGYPVRLLAPGHAGCRNVKWVREIIISEEVSELDSGSKLDRHFAPDVSFLGHLRHGDDHVRLDQGPVIQTLPVQSVICSPLNGETLNEKDGTVEVKGVAWSGGGRGICRVEVSSDGGANFSAAELVKNPDPEGPSPQCGVGRNWTWQQFSKRVELSEEDKEKLAKGEKVNLEIVARAVDGDLNQQPEKMEQTWNVLGICVNHWPRVNVVLDPTSGDKPATPKPPHAGAYPGYEDYPGMKQNTPSRKN